MRFYNVMNVNLFILGKLNGQNEGHSPQLHGYYWVSIPVALYVSMVKQIMKVTGLLAFTINNLYT